LDLNSLQAAPGAINLANFNEFDMQLDMALPFSLDQLPAPDQWMAAASQTMARRQDITVMDSEMGGDSGLSLSMSSRRGKGGGINMNDDEQEEGNDFEEEEQEDWAATEFDPRDENAAQEVLAKAAEDGEEEDLPPVDFEEEEDDSIEYGRDADSTPNALGRGARGLSISGVVDDSVGSGKKGRSSLSISASKGGILGDDYGNDLAPLEDEEEGDEDDLPPMDPTLDDVGGINDVSLGGLEEDEAEGGGASVRASSRLSSSSSASPVAAEAAPVVARKPRKPRKRRLVVDEVTELSRSQIKENQQHTEDIVRECLPPHLRPEGAGSAAPRKKLPTLKERMRMPNTPGLAPELLEMFSWTMRDDPLPFRLRKGFNYAGPIKKKPRMMAGATPGDDATAQEVPTASPNHGAAAAAAEESGDEEHEEEPQPVDDVETARANQGEDADFNFQNEEEEFAPFPDEEEDQAPPASEEENEEEPALADMSSIMNLSAVNGSFLADAGRFELGAVNDLNDSKNGLEDDDDDKASVYSDGGEGKTTRSMAHWHPHTKKVMSMLETQFEVHDDVSYNKISGVNAPKGKRATAESKKVGRRTAAGVFFELLQLKTWDFIEVAQPDGAYADIFVSKGPRFDDGAPQLGE
jgi:cohesin complex subunit SCC1